MNILITAATATELSIADDCLSDLPVMKIVSGVGMVNTAFHLGNYFANHKPDLAINIGIAGSFSHARLLTDVVLVNEDAFAWFGASSPEGFLPFQMNGKFDNTIAYERYKASGLSLFNEFIANNIVGKGSSIDQVKGITVQTVSGTKEEIEKLKAYYQPDIETMEGAAFFYACQLANVPSIQIRALSNYVEERNKAKWKVNEALQALKARLDLFSF